MVAYYRAREALPPAQGDEVTRDPPQPDRRSGLHRGTSHSRRAACAWRRALPPAQGGERSGAEGVGVRVPDASTHAHGDAHAHETVAP